MMKPILRRVAPPAKSRVKPAGKRYPKRRDRGVIHVVQTSSAADIAGALRNPVQC